MNCRLPGAYHFVIMNEMDLLFVVVMAGQHAWFGPRMFMPSLRGIYVCKMILFGV